MNNNVEKLNNKIQKWIYLQGWNSLRKIQCDAIDPILSRGSDVIISASTAAGKTEAFFLPAVSTVLDCPEGVSILYISPLKALINDQSRRLESLSDITGVSITSWHGDSSVGGKNRLKKTPSGIVLITPESLESVLIRHPSWVKSAFNSLKYIAIDEFHAFIGSERGHHLISLLHRLEHLLGKLKSPVPRIALSATLGEIQKIPLSLRPNGSFPCEIIQDSDSKSVYKIQVRGYTRQQKIAQMQSEYKICQDLYKFCRGGNHLIFANSRERTEGIAATLKDLCEKNNVPNEFFPHHGSLAKELRETLENRLQKHHHPTSAVCTMTLELGIDIGKVDSIIQVTAPHSVSSLRQRMGRSGRRGTPAELRMLITVNELSKNSNLVDYLRLELIQSLAMVRLLVAEKWFEPADNQIHHYSTLVHQILAVIAQWGGVRAEQLFQLLCKDGPFQKVSVSDFKAILTNMGKTELLTQLNSGEIALGIQGERISSHYSFYAVFNTPVEYRILHGVKMLGTLPFDSLVLVEQKIVFGGNRWVVKDIDAEKKIIHVEKNLEGKPPKFIGSGISIHDKIRQEMYEILKHGDYRILVGNQKVDFADRIASELFIESAEFFSKAQLDRNIFLHFSGNTYVFPWLGDKITNTIKALLANTDLKVSSFAGVIEIEKKSIESVQETLLKIINHPLPNEYELAELIPNKCVDKYDEFLPKDVLSKAFGARAFDVAGAEKWLRAALF